jgi:tetratricopeptide (TPR) repeat protein
LARSTQIHLSYLQQMVLPFGLSPEYAEGPAAWSSAATIVASAALLGLLGLGVAAAWRRRRPLLALVILGAMGLALPTSNLWAMPNLRADRLMYIPSIAVALGLAALLVAIGRAWASRGPSHRLLVPIVAMLILQGALAQGAATTYRSDTRLWDTALRHAPGSARAHAVRGELYAARLEGGEADPRAINRASAHCSIAQRLAPDQALPWLCGARLAVAQRDWSLAHRLFERALARKMDREDRVLAALASVALDRPDRPYPQRTVEARELADRATHEYPYSAQAYATAASVHHRLADAERARELYARARALRPERWDVVLAGVELELDLGHASAARAAWAAHEDLLLAADPARREHVRRRLHDAERLWGP